MDRLHGVSRPRNEAVRRSVAKLTWGNSTTGIIIFICALVLAGGSPANAVDISGAWASDARACDTIFQRKGAVVSLTSRANTSGSGFVIDGDKIRGKVANCKIKTRKEEGDLVHLIAACATDVMLSDIEMTLKIIDDNKIARVFAGMPEMETPYYRCPR